MRIAAIDIGTVTSRVLVADVTSENGQPVLQEIERDLQITHLGEGLDASGELKAEAVRRVVDAASTFAQRARGFGAECIAAVATSAARDASNRETLTLALAEAGAPTEVIGGDREAYLSFLGATYALSGEGILVADLGGGSTELIFGRRAGAAPEVRAAHSFDVGSKRMTERVLLDEHPPSPAALREGYEWARREMLPFFEALPGRPEVLLSLAGTATSLSALNMGMVEYDPELVHDSELTAEDLERLFDSLAGLTLPELRAVPGLHPGRASVIVAGALILRVVVELAGLHSTMVSEHDILYGIALDAYLAGGRQ